MLRKLNYTPGKIESYRNDYMLHTAFHTYLLSEEFKEFNDMDDEEKNELKQNELDRVARTILVALSSERAINN